MKTLLGMAFALLSVAASAQGPLGGPRTETFEQLAELTGTEANAFVSRSIALSSDTLVIGAPVATTPGGCVECGVAYVYTAVNGDWTNLQLTATLTQSSGQSLGGFGDSVSVSGVTVVVSGYDSNSGLGSVYVYINPSGTVTENAELTTSGAPSGAFDSVSIDGGTVVAGSPSAQVGGQRELGAAYVYVAPSGGWANMTQTAELVSKSESGNSGFGDSVAIGGRTVVVGEPRASVGGVAVRGRAYVYVEPSDGWSGTRGQTAELEPSNGARNALFGLSVSVSGATVAVGAPGETVGSNQAQGAVYIFAEPAAGWPMTMTQTAEVTAASGKAGSEMGYSVAMSDRTLFTGAPYVHSERGIAYVFSEPPGGWQNLAAGEEISASDGAANNLFGWGVAIGGGVLGVSAYGWPDGGLSAFGAVYVFGEGQ
jgi:FG-GAP repeat